MTFADLMSTTPADRWANLPEVSRDAIGAKLVEHVFADLVMDDDGLETTAAEREAAGEMQSASFNELFRMVEAAFPAVMWNYPEPVTYELRDKHGSLTGTVESTDLGKYRFAPVSSGRRRGRPVYGVPADALPLWSRRIVERGGWFGAVFASGALYPDDSRPEQLHAEDRAVAA